MVYHEKQLIHVHPPKTGGQAAQEALGISHEHSVYDSVYRHATLGDIYRVCPEARDYLVAISVRDPAERLVSFYYYVMYARNLAGDPTKEYVREFGDAFDFLRCADFDMLQRINYGEAVLRPMSWYLSGEAPDIVWPLEDVGYLLPVVNRKFDHYMWDELGGDEVLLPQNPSLRRFLEADAQFGYVHV